jgi:amino acid adenylation domain-containing protein
VNGGDAGEMRDRGDLAARLSALAPAQRALLERTLEQQRRRAAPPAGAAPRQQEAPQRIPRRPPGSIVPLSLDQERLWFIQQLDRLSPVYNIYGANRFRGAIEVPLLIAALNLLVARHEVLRTTFPAIDGRPVQQIAAELRVTIPLIDLRRLPDGVREAEARRRAAVVVSAPFDLERLPLFRVRLLRVADDDTICPICIHHIVTDWISYYAMESELTAVYLALRSGTPPALPELPIQFADFAVWQRQRLADGSVLADQLDYWRRHLEGAPELLPLPTDRPRPPVQTPRGARRRLILLPAQSDAVRALARREEATLFVTVLAVWKVLLMRWSGQERLIVGTPMAYRQGPDLEGVLGFFLNQLPLYSDLTGNPPFREALRRVRDMAHAAYAHQDLPFARLVEALHPERDLSRVPYTQVVFLLLNPDQLQRPAMDGTAVEGYWVDAHRTQFDMQMALWDPGPGTGFFGWIEHSTDLFDGATIGRMREQLRTLVAAVAADPDRRVWDLPLLPDAQRHQLVAEWPAGDAAADHPASLAGRARSAPLAGIAGAPVHAQVLAQAAVTPAAPAVIAAGRSWTYGELARRVERVALALGELRLPAESVVGVCLERTPDLVAGLLGVLAAGHAYLPLDPSHPEERRRFMLDDAGAAALLVDGENASWRAGADAGCGAWSACRLDLAELLRAGPGASGATAANGAAGARLDPDRLAYVIYTSGSTGRPKGVEVRHGALSQLLGAMRERPGITARDRLLAVTTVAFDIAGLELFLPLIAGAAVVLAGRDTAADGWQLLDLAAATGATLMQATPATWRLLLAAGWGEGQEGRGLAAWCGGEALSVELAAALTARAPRVWNLYGPTETTIWSAVEQVRAAPGAADRAGTPAPPALPEIIALGRPTAGTRLHVLDPWLQPAPLGVSGELAIGGAGLARGYRRRPELTAERFVPDPFGAAGDRLYRTGDRVRLRPQGSYEFLGRFDQQVKLRGYRIELGEIERVLASHPAVRHAAVLLHQDRPGGPAGQQLAAWFVARQPGAGPDAASLRAWLRERLPEYMLPATLTALDALPLTANGKLDRRALARIAPAAETAPVVGRAPGGPLEELVGGILGEVLGLPRMGPDDDFFALGGHSLAAFQAVARLRQALAVELPVPVLFARPTPAALAAELAARLGSLAPALPPLVAAAGRGATAPLAFAQRRLWFLDRLRPGATAYNLAVATRLPAGIDPAVLAAAASEVVRRHEALRTTFGPAPLPPKAPRAPNAPLAPTGLPAPPSAAGAIEAPAAEPVQRIAPATPLRLPRVRLAALPGSRRESEMLRLAAGCVRLPFDLERGPLLRLLLLETAEGEGGSALVVAIHHIVSDAWSLSLLCGELAALAGAFAAGRSSPLPALALQYADYAIWQRAALAGEPLAAMLAWWRRQLEGAPALLELPTDRPRPAVRGEAGASRPAGLSEPLTAALAAIARRERATPFMVLLAGFAALLGRLARQDDVVVGAPIAGRTERALEDLIGCFVNTLALRTDLSGEPPFAELLRRVRGATLQAYVHSALPFEKLVEELAPARDLSQTPLFQAVLTLHNTPAPSFAGAGADAGRAAAEPEPVALTSWTAKFDLTLELTPIGAGLAGRLEYSTDLWDGASVSRFLAHWTELLTAAVADPERPWRELPLLGAAERHQLVREWNEPMATGAGATEPAAAAPAPPRLHRCFESWAARQPEAPAVLYAGVWLGYGDLNARANRLARHLRARGVGPESVVALLLPPSHELVTALLAVQKAGGAYLPLDPDAPRERLAFQLADAGASVAVTAGDEGAAALRAAGGALSVVDLAAAADEMESLAPGDLAAEPDADGLAYVIYTSGSTGRPKGTEISHRNQARLFRAARPAIGFDDGDVWLLAHSYAFDFSVWELWGALAFGGRLVVAPLAVRRSPAALAELLAAAGVTILNQTPSAFYQLAARGEGAGWRPGAALRRVIFGGEALDPSRLDGWLAGGDLPRLINMYGITETTVHVTLRPLTAADARRGGSPLGRPLPDLAVHLLDPSLEPVPVAVAGEIYVGGAGLARGYRRRPDLTAWRFVPDPFAGPDAAGSRLYRSGDLARRTAGGEIEYLGRVDQQVKVRGFRIEPGEIEAALTALPEVREAAVLARHEPGGEARLVAYLVAGPEAPPPADEILARLRRQLPDYMLPAAFVTLPALPRTGNGKLDRGALPAPEAVRPDLGRPYEAPRSLAEEVLAAVWARVLAVDRVGRDDNFFALGGDSIRSLQVLDLARERGVRFELDQLFRHQTVAELAQAAATAGPRPEDQPVAPFSLLAAADRAALPPGLADAYPLTLLQAGMLFYLEATPEYPLYQNVDSLEIQARCDPAAFQRALDRVAARHPVLRTAFDLTSYGEPLQLVHASARLRLGVVDLRGLPAAARQPLLPAFVQAEKRRRFDLLRPPLLRFHLHLLGEDRFQVTLTECHAILDGWSLNSILAEIFGHYLAAVHGQPPPAEPAASVAFRDYVAMERQALADPLQRDFWRGKLAGAAATELPRCLVSRPEGGAPASIVQASVPGPTAAGLMRLAAAAAVPLKSVCLAAHLRMLQLAASRTDVITGLVVNGRPESAGGERVRGLFLNTLPLRLATASITTWNDLVRAAFAAECEILPFRRYPFAALQWDWGKEPMLPAAFNYTRFHLWQAVVDRGWQVATGGGFAVELEENHFPLMVNFNYDDKLERLRLTLDTQMSAPAAQALLAHYLGVLAAMSADPAALVEETAPRGEWQRTLAVLERCAPTAAPGVALRERGERREAAGPAPYAAPRGQLEERLAAIFAEALGRGSIGADDSFFDLGGHSLLAMRAVARARAAFGCQLTLRDLFEAPTVAALARKIAVALRASPGSRFTAGVGAGAPVLVDPDAVIAAAGPAAAFAAAPLSSSQLRLWFLWQLDPASPVFNMPLPLRLAGPLDLPALAGALSEIVRRHATLRTTFGVGNDGQPVQRAAPAVAAVPPLIDLSALAGEARGGEAARLVAAEALLPFDLARGPLFRPRIVRLAAAEHVLTATMHHVICDGWSHEIFLREMAQLYAAATAGLPSPLPELPIQYSDFAAWQRAALDAPALAGHVAYWRGQLAGVPAALELPASRPRPPVQSARGGSRRLALPEGLPAAAVQLGRRLGATPFMTLLAALAALLGRHSGQTDLVVGAPVAGRDRGETHGLIGFFLNTLPLRCDLAGDPAFAELLRRVRAAVLEAFAHQDLPFEHLLEELRLVRDQSRTPLFQVFCNWQGFGARGETGTAPHLPGLVLEPFAAGQPLAKFDLELYAVESGSGFELDLVYNRDLFDDVQAAEIERHFAQLLAAVVADPQRRLSEIALQRAAAAMITGSGRSAAAAGAAEHLRGDAGHFPAAALDRSLFDRFAEQAAAHPGRVAVRTAGEAWTYARLDSESRAIAHTLLAGGGPAGERIALLSGPGAWQAAAVLGVLASGKTYVPLDPSYPHERLLAIVEDAAAGALLVAPGAAPAAPEAPEATAALAGLLAGNARLPVISAASLPPAPAGWVPPAVPPEAVAYLLYTSGTTGGPKGVMQSHRNVLAHLRAYGNRLGIGPEDRLSMLSTLSFDAAVMDLFGALLNGAELCPYDLRDEGVDRLGGFLVRRAVTIVHSTPTVFRALAAGLDGGHRFPGVRLVVLGGEEATRRDLELVRRHFDPACRLVNGLGPTESTLALQAFLDPGAEPERPGLPVGHPVAGTEVALVHAAGEQAATWGVGEIVIGSPHLALGYWRAPDRTAAAFVPDPRRPGGRKYRTGDLGRLLPDGGIEFCGRRDQQVKIRGVRVEPAEVEALLAAHPAVAQAAVVAYQARPGDPAGWRLAAFFSARPGAGGDAPAPDALRELLRARLPAAMVPDLLAALDVLPTGPTGKVDRRALAELAARTGRPAAAQFAAPESETEQTLAAIWSELLGIERIARDDDFFDLGGHSLLVTRVRSRLEAALGIDLPLAELFAAPTLAAAAAAADRARRQPAPAAALRIAPIRREAHRMRRDALDPEP